MPWVDLYFLSPTALFWVLLRNSARDSFLHQPQPAGFEMATALSLSQGVPGLTRVKLSQKTAGCTKSGMRGKTSKS